MSSLRNRAAALTALGAAFVLSMAGCGSAGSGGGESASSPAPSRTATASPSPSLPSSSHTARPGEPALVAVPGYDYANLGGKDARMMKELVRANPERLKAGSVHVVLKDGILPIAVIFLAEMRLPDLPQVRESVLRGMAQGQALTGMRLSWKTIHGEKVMVAKSPSEAVYGWYTNVMATVSGDNSSDVRDFVEAYLQAAHAT